MLGTFARSHEPKVDVEEAYQCTGAKCGRVFLAIFKSTQPGVNPPQYEFSRVAPIEPRKPAVSEIVATLSPNFVDTYSQALVAESFNLGQLTGIGLRKALEFLVKDFALAEHPAEREKILKKTLAACIKDYITDPSVKELAKRAAWLGNDETHYVRRWEEKDISDLKVLLRLTLNGVENILLTKKYIAEMPE